MGPLLAGTAARGGGGGGDIAGTRGERRGGRRGWSYLALFFVVEKFLASLAT
jgi:hypothetical protein